MAKSFNISKHEVWNAYLTVKANKGAATNGVQENGLGICILKILCYLHIGESGVGWENNKSRMNQEVHVRSCEKLKIEISSAYSTRIEKLFSHPKNRVDAPY